MSVISSMEMTVEGTFICIIFLSVDRLIPLDAICDKPKEKVTSNNTNFPRTQVFHVVRLEKSKGKQGVQVSEVTNLASTQRK